MLRVQSVSFAMTAGTKLPGSAVHSAGWDSPARSGAERAGCSRDESLRAGGVSRDL